MSSDADEERDGTDRRNPDDRPDPDDRTDGPDDLDRAWGSEDDLAEATAVGDDEAVYAGGDRSENRWFYGALAVLLIGVGALLFLFPEPATSVTGIVLLVVGLAVWLSRVRD